MQKPSLKPSLKDRVFGDARRIAPEKEMVMIHHVLMKEYGWIPLEELKQTPINTIFDLIECIRKEAEQMERSMQSSKRRRGRR